jgi:hypothetical protein
MFYAIAGFLVGIILGAQPAPVDTPKMQWTSSGIPVTSSQAYGTVPVKNGQGK